MTWIRAAMLWCTATLSAHASIVNVLSPDVGNPDDGWDSSAKLSLQHLSGNEQKLTFSLLAGTRYVAGPNQVLLKGSGDWGEASNEVYSKKAFAHLRWKRRLNPTWSAFTFAQVDHNEFRSLLMRDLAGVGFEARLIQSDHFDLAIATSAMAELEWVLEQEKPEALSWRSSNYMTLAWQPNEQLTVGSTTFLQPLFKAFSDIRGFQQVDFNIVVNKYISFTTRWKLEFDTEPAESDVEELDSSITSGLKVRW